MARKGVLPKGVKLEPYIISKDGKRKIPRCQFVRKVGVQCSKPAMIPRPNCRSHGGKSGAPLTAGGKFSKYAPVPRGLLEKYERAKLDPEILNLTSKIALLDASITKLCEDASKQDDFDEKQMRKLLKLLKEHRDLVAQETSRRVALGAMLEVSQVMQILTYVYSAIAKNVSDPLTRNRIAAELRSLVQSDQTLLLLEEKKK